MGVCYGIKHVGGKFPPEMIEKFNRFAEAIRKAGYDMDDNTSRRVFFKYVKKIEPEMGNKIVKWLKSIDMRYADISYSWAFWYRIDPESGRFYIKFGDEIVYMDTEKGFHYFMRHQAKEMFFFLISYFLYQSQSKERIQFKVITDIDFSVELVTVTDKGVEHEYYGEEP